MNDDLHTFIEPELQARIAALVLDEASEFERDELEKLIAEKPELAIYQRRMQAMHDLLGDTVKPAKDSDWQLSSKKREKLRQTFATKGELASSGGDGQTGGTARVQIRSAAVIAACLLITVILFSMATPVVLKQKREKASAEVAQYEMNGGLDLDESMSATEEDIVWASEKAKRQPGTRSVDRKPSAPSSSMSKVIASNTTSPTAVPVPEPAPAPDPTVDFGNGDDFADGWGGAKKGKGGSGGGGGGDLADAESDPFAASDSTDDKKASVAIAGKKNTKDHVIRREIPKRPSENMAKAEEKSVDDTYKSKSKPTKWIKSGNATSAQQPDDALYSKDRSIAEKEQIRRGVVRDGDRLLAAQSSERLRKDSTGRPADESGELAFKQRDGKLDAIKSVNEANSRSFYFRHANQSEGQGKSNVPVPHGETTSGIATGGFTSGDRPVAGGDVDGVFNSPNQSGNTRDDDSFLTGKPGMDAPIGFDRQSSAEMPDSMPGVQDGRGKDLGGLVPGASKSPPVTPRPVRLGELGLEKGASTAEKEAESRFGKQAESFSWSVEVPTDALPIDPTQTGIAMTELTLKTDGEARKNLYTAEAYYNLGKYDKAEAEMKKVLQKDPDNKAARRWLEKVADTKSDYYRAAYDQTRTEKLDVVDSAWEIAGAPQVKLEDEAQPALRPKTDNKSPEMISELSSSVREADREYEKTKGEIIKLKASGLNTKHPKLVELEKRLKETRANLRKTAEAVSKPSARPNPLPEETLTRAQPFSTFSLNVNDVSFKLARVALLEKGRWPDATKVRTEEFVNAFDYGDPSPRRGEPVACAIEQSAHPFLQQRNLLRVGMKTAAMGRSTPLRLTVLLDNSGSMEREDREASVLAAMQVLAAQLNPQDVITVISFARQPRLIADRIPGNQAAKLVDLVEKIPSEGGTNLEEALRLARKLAKRQHSEGAQSRVVLITDGVANLGNTVPEQLSIEVETMRQQGIAFDACGVGAEGLNDDILEALTRKGDGRYYFLNRPEDADAGFVKQLAGALTPAAKNVKVQVVFNPKRVARYRLLGFEKHRLNKEDFRNDKVDAAEMAAEEAGNAVYQVQVNPQGEGDLGEVFVRFLDASTGRMVERSWPLAYQPQAKPFDLATPSMQLAGTAAMLGEKLHGTDAGSVRFSMISDTLGKLKAHYASDTKVQDLIRMCRKAE